MEGTGYERALVGALAAAHLPVAAIRPPQARFFVQAIGRTAKTDAIAAEVLAAFGGQLAIEARPVTDSALGACGP